MKIAIIRAAGMVGHKLTQRLVSEGTLRGRAISSLLLADIVAADSPAGFGGESVIQAGNPETLSGCMSRTSLARQLAEDLAECR